jgi:hypothetical protein
LGKLGESHWWWFFDEKMFDLLGHSFGAAYDRE